MPSRGLAAAMIGIGIVVVVCVFLGAVIWHQAGRQRRTAENLAGLANRLGLELRVVKKAFGMQVCSVEGARHGRGVRFWTYTTGSGKSQRHWIAVGVQPRRCGAFTFRIEPQGFGTRIAEFFGAKEIQVGERRFDEAWFVRTNAPEVLRAALVPEIQEKLMAGRDAGSKGSYELQEGRVTYAEEGSFARPEAVARLEALLPLLMDLADVTELCAGGP